MNHTPGPWAVADMVRPAVVIGDVVLKMPIDDVGRANARLVAAAPDLLSALSAMMTHMGGKENSWNKPTFDQARRAIAKATGKEQA